MLVSRKVGTPKRRSQNLVFTSEPARQMPKTVSLKVPWLASTLCVCVSLCVCPSLCVGTSCPTWRGARGGARFSFKGFNSQAHRFKALVAHRDVFETSLTIY